MKHGYLISMIGFLLRVKESSSSINFMENLVFVRKQLRWLMISMVRHFSVQFLFNLQLFVPGAFNSEYAVSFICCTLFGYPIYLLGSKPLISIFHLLYLDVSYGTSIWILAQLLHSKFMSI